MAGQNDAAMTYEPYLSTVRDNPASGRILATTLDYPMVMDTVGCDPTWLKANAKAAQALTHSSHSPTSQACIFAIMKSPMMAGEALPSPHCGA